jgi:RTX calcium-binding nonapeptide repeat (4 copies)
MTGGAGNDTMEGRGGNDTMNGESGNDIVRGEGGNDILVGGADNDNLTGSSGNDQLRLRDAELDRPGSCGDGTDSVSMDLVDFAGLGFLAFAGCETVTIGAVNEGPNVVISRSTPKIKKSGKVPVRLACPPELTAPCAGTLTLGRSPNKQGSPNAYSLDPGASMKVTGRLSRKDRRKLSRGGELTAITISVEQGEFGDKTTAQTLELAPRRRHT